MPPPRKVDLLPAELKAWLQEELRSRGFGDYVALTDALNERLEAEGQELRIGKSAVHAFGQEYEHFVKAQEQASSWAAGWMNDNGLEEEAKRHNVLFQMVTTLAFKVMQAQMIKEGDEIDPRELHFLGKMLKDVMSSSGIRQKLMEEERTRVERQAREQAAATVEKHARSAGMTAETAEAIKAEILGVSA